MSLNAVTVSCVSPLFTFDPPIGRNTTPGWSINQDSTFVSPLPYPSYTASCVTSAAKASFSFSFYGTTVSVDAFSECVSQLWLEGETEPRSINNQTSAYPLLKAQNLPKGVNKMRVDVQCPKASDPFFTNDFRLNDIQVDGWFSGGNDFPQTQTIDDQDPALEYKGNWQSNARVQTTNYYNTSQHTSNTVGDTLRFTFNKEFVSIWGSVGPNHGAYSVQISDGPDTSVRTYNVSAPKAAAPIVLFFQGGLDLGKPHTVTVTNLGPGTLDIDGIQLKAPYSFGTASLTIPIPSYTGTGYPTHTIASTKGTAVGVIVGPIIGIFAVAFFAGVGFFLHRQRQKQRANFQQQQYGEPGVVETYNGSNPPPNPGMQQYGGNVPVGWPGTQQQQYVSPNLTGYTTSEFSSPNSLSGQPLLFPVPAPTIAPSVQDSSAASYFGGTHSSVAPDARSDGVLSPPPYLLHAPGEAGGSDPQNRFVPMTVVPAGSSTGAAVSPTVVVGDQKVDHQSQQQQQQQQQQQGAPQPSSKH